MTPVQREAAEYLHELATEMAKITRLNGLHVAAFCFEMAALETEPVGSSEATASRRQ